MSLREYGNLIAAIGSIQQKNAQSAYVKHMSKPVSTPDMIAHSNQGAGAPVVEPYGDDVLSISRSAMAALETTQIVSDETIIRDDDTAGKAVAYLRSRIIDRPGETLSSQTNQREQRVAALYER
jgi:hypothetical protein